jgi:chaperonin cofactor prefoldin
MLYSDEINNIKGDKESLENKLTTLQDEHTRTNQQLQSTQNELTVKTSTYETHIKMLESQQTRSEEKTQQKIKALEQELESIRAYQNYSNPMISRALPQSTTSSQTKQGTSDEASLDSEVVAVGSSIDPGGGVEKRRVKTTHVVSGEEFVDMDAFDASSLSSACSSTSYDA